MGGGCDGSLYVMYYGLLLHSWVLWLMVVGCGLLFALSPIHSVFLVVPNTGEQGHN